jgi:endonuclease/exonuclease/phosphatase family metal-dependent hydrolase
VRLAVLALVVTAAAACGSDHPRPLPPTQPAAGQIRVMSYNVNFGIAGDPPSIAALAGANPDIVVLQETNDVWEQALIDALGARFPHRRFRAPPGWPASGFGILSRFPIVRLDELPAIAGPFIAWRIVLDTPLGRIQILNLHLRPPMSDGGSWVVGYWSTREVRLQELQYHLESLDKALPTLIAGDFNEEGDGLAMRHLTDRGFADAIATHRGDDPTWSWPVSSGLTLRFQLDHLLHDVHFVAVAAAIVEGGRSDHKPIWADLERIDP